jgi:hypothetical protein
MDIHNLLKFNFTKSTNIVIFNGIIVPKFKIFKLSFYIKNDNYYYELLTNIPNHSLR